MDVVRFPHVLSVSTIAALALFTHTVRADTWNFALVRCDEAAGELEVKGDSTEDAVEKYKTPEGYQSKWLGELVEYVSPPDGTPDDVEHGTYRHKIGEWQLSCTLKGAVYNVVISPWSINDMVMGECGGGDPDVELTVQRNKRVFVKNVRLGGTCSIGPNDSVFIGSVKLSEPQKTATLGDIKIPYSDMPLLDQKKLRSSEEHANQNSNLVPPGAEKEATRPQTCQSEDGEFTPNRNSAGGLILGPAGSRIRLYRQHPALCNSGDVATCEGRAYLVPGDVVEAGTTCGDYVHVRYIGKNHISTGWIEKRSLGERQAPAVSGDLLSTIEGYYTSRGPCWTRNADGSLESCDGGPDGDSCLLIKKIDATHAELRIESFQASGHECGVSGVAELSGGKLVMCKAMRVTTMMDGGSQLMPAPLSSRSST
jgi:hypothetical protein